MLPKTLTKDKKVGGYRISNFEFGISNLLYPDKIISKLNIRNSKSTCHFQYPFPDPRKRNRGNAQIIGDIMLWHAL